MAVRDLGSRLVNPPQQVMGVARPVDPGHLGAVQAVLVQQDTNLCCRTCLCQPNINFNMQAYTGQEEYRPGDQIPATWHITEESTCCFRAFACCCPGMRPTTWTVRDGPAAGGGPDSQVLMTHSKGLTCSHCPRVCITDKGELVSIPWCCCLPYLETRDGQGNILGRTNYVCDAFPFVPKFDVFDASERHLYRVLPESCCLGCCIRCRCGGRGSGGRRLRVPHVVREPREPYAPIDDAAITDLWAGLARQLCTKQDVFAVKFPSSYEQGVDINAAKATLVGATLLLNMLMYEHD